MNVLRSYLIVLFVMAASGSSWDDSDTEAKMICEATPTTQVSTVLEVLQNLEDANQRVY